MRETEKVEGTEKKTTPCVRDMSLVQALRHASDCSILGDAKILMAQAADALETFWGIPCWRSTSGTDVLPPFEKSFLAAVGSFEDRGRGFKPKISIYEVVMRLVGDYGEDDMEDARQELDAIFSQERKWNDTHFALYGPDGEQLDFWSDSIMYWTEKPILADVRSTEKV